MTVRLFTSLLGLLFLMGCGSMPGGASLRSRTAGHLLVVGGGLEDDAKPVFERFLSLASLPGSPRLVIITAANAEDEDQTNVAIDKVEALRAWAPGVPVEAIRRQTSTADTVAAVDRATGIFFTGGDQALIGGRYRPGGKETPEWLAMRRLLARGGVIAGGSAGDAMMGDLMLLGGNGVAVLAPDQSSEASAKLQMAPGMAFLPWVITDSHFFERHRIGRLVAALEVSGRRLGIGVGEDAAVEIDLASGVVTGVTVSDSLLVDVESMQRDGLARRNVRARLIRQGERVSLRHLLNAKLPPPSPKPTGPAQVVQIVDPGQNRQLALWRAVMGASRPGSGRWEIRFPGWEMTAWSDGGGRIIFDVNPTPRAR